MGHRSLNFCGVSSTRTAVPGKSRHSKASFQLAIEDKPSKPSILFAGGRSVHSSGAGFAAHAPPNIFESRGNPARRTSLHRIQHGLINRFAVVASIMREGAMHPHPEIR